MKSRIGRNTTTRVITPALLLTLSPLYFQAHAQSFVEPTSWTRGDALTTFQEWDNFSTTQGATPDASDNNPDGPAALTENTASFITSTSNIYSFQDPLDFDVVVPVADIDSPELYDLTVIIQTQSLGTPFDPASVVIEGVISGDIAPVDSALLGSEVLGDPDEVGGGFGEFRWFLFNLPYAEFADGSADATSFSLSLSAVESSMSFDRLLIDTALSPASAGFFDEPTPVVSTITGDYNGDGFVSQSDLDLVLLNWGSDALPADFKEAALDGGGPFDELVTQNELDGVLLNWGEGTPLGLAAVPEPAAGVILALMGLASHRRNLNRTKHH